MTTKNSMIYEKIDGIARISIDSPKREVNILSQKNFNEFAKIFEDIQSDDEISAAYIISNKEKNFIAGADISEIKQLSSYEEAYEKIRAAQNFYKKLAQSSKPFIAAINGACLGGGLELALACQYRLAVSNTKTFFAFPEVKLGLLPAGCGTSRLPRLIGLKAALDILLQGKKIGAKKAFKIGLVDELVDTQYELERAAKSIASQHSKFSKKNKKLLLSLPLLLIAAKKVNEKSGHHYPAPFAILKTLYKGIVRGFDEGLKSEAHEFAKLSQEEVCKNLIRFFFLKQAKSKNPFAKNSKPITKMAIVGAGHMGSGIAAVSLEQGIQVILLDKEQESLQKAQTFIKQEFNKKLAKKMITKLEKERLFSGLEISSDLEKVGTADLIIEAVSEDLKIKQNLLGQLEKIMNEQAIFASNTSSLPIKEIANVSKLSNRILGMHYFSPVAKIPLLEIIRPKDCSEQSLSIAFEIGLKQKKTMVVVNDSPGFFTTRVIASLFDEASILLLEGNSAKSIDKNLSELGFPMGPIALMDDVGLDVGYHVSKILKERLGSRLIAADLSLCKTMVEQKLLGRKTKIGFYNYNNHRGSENKKIKEILSSINYERKKTGFSMGERMLLRMVNEASFCLSENIIDSEDDGDLAAVFGIGFPAYLGGPFRYIAKETKKRIGNKLDELANDFGERFQKSDFF